MEYSKKHREKKKIHGLPQVDHHSSTGVSDCFSNVFHVDINQHNCSDVIKEILKRHERESNTRLKTS